MVRGRLEAANALLLAAAVSGADNVLVHSHLAARLARLELHEARIPVEVVPFGHPDPVPIERERSHAAIATFGAVEPEKQPLVLLKALATVRQHVPEATLDFVGSDPDPAFRTRMEQVAVRLGISESVRFAGRVDEASYHEWLQTATIAVQLRGVVNGEASAAVADCLAAGVPTVVTDIGTQAELPPGSTVPVAPGIDGPALGQLLADLLKDPGRRDRLSKAAQVQATASSFSVAAAALSRALKAAPPPHW
jgi:glycosyltransferase involved in cell wall biosynthesis